jgi:hypothetical protein
MDLSQITKPEELLDAETAFPQYQFGQFIRTSTAGERRLAKRKLKIIKLLHDDLSNILDEDEEVFFISDGVLVRSLEQFFIGWVAYYYNFTAFVFTTNRVLLFHIKKRTEKGVYLRSLDYGDILSVKGGMTRRFQMILRNGTKLLFSRVPVKDKKELSSFLNEVLDSSAPKDTKAMGLRNLCPNCLSDHGDAIVDRCAACGTEFKSPKTAALRSLLLPGSGDLYLGSKLLGGFELVVMGFLWFGVISTVVSAIALEGFIWTLLIPPAVFWMIIHPIDAMKSYYMGNKGLYPKVPVSVYGREKEKAAGGLVATTRKSSQGLYALLTSIVLAGFFLPVLSSIFLLETGLVAENVVVDGSEFSDTIRDRLIGMEVIREEDDIIYIYGNGFQNYFVAGSLLTEDRFVTYFHDEAGSLVVYEMSYDEVTRLDLVEDIFDSDVSLYVIESSEIWIQFYLPYDRGTAELFLQHLRERIP